jgi:hypothetical protein
MYFYRRFSSMSLLTRLSLACLALIAALCSAGAAIPHSMTVESGVPHSCPPMWRVDMQGKEWPVTVQYTSKPANGTVRTQVTLQPKALKDSTIKTVHIAQVIYQSRKGFVGQDSFSFRRVTGDPTDPNNNQEYTIAVTVR